MTTRADQSTIGIGALAPLSAPGWVDAGRELLAGLSLGIEHANEAGGVDGRTLELLVRDTAASPVAAGAAVEELAGLGVAALVGEYHSVAARAVAARADALRVPFLCSSAVIDELVGRPSDLVARLAPPQSRGWRLFADFLLRAGHRTIAIAAGAGPYWQAGSRIIKHRLSEAGARTELVDPDLAKSELVDRLASSGATALLLLVGTPKPALELVRAVRDDPRLAGMLVGAPAGQPELAHWSTALGRAGAGIPFLRYMPDGLSAQAEAVVIELARRLGHTPSFVALEGHDAATVIARALQAGSRQDDADGIDWKAVDLEGTRGRIRFGAMEGVDVLQWISAPIQVVDRSPDDLAIRVLHPAWTTETMDSAVTVTPERSVTSDGPPCS